MRGFLFQGPGEFRVASLMLAWRLLSGTDAPPCGARRGRGRRASRPGQQQGPDLGSPLMTRPAVP